MDRIKAWEKIRESIPGSFYKAMRADNLEKEIRLSLPVLKDQVHFTPFNELVKYHREISMLDECIEREREFNLAKQDEFSKRWDLAYGRIQDVNCAIQKFSEYHKGCQSKIQRDTTTLRSTQNLICDKDREIRKLNKELKKLQEVKNAIEKRRNRCESMKDYLEEVVRSSGNEYENVQELIARFEDLKQIRDERSQKTFHGLANRVDTLHTDQLETKRAETEAMAYSSHAASLDKYKDQLKSHNGKLTEDLIDIQELNHTEILKVEHPKLAIYSMYLNLCSEMNQPVDLSENDIKGQLEFIQTFLGELAKLKDRVRGFFQGDSDIVEIPDEYLKRLGGKDKEPKKEIRKLSIQSTTTAQQIELFKERHTKSKPLSQRSDTSSPIPR